MSDTTTTTTSPTAKPTSNRPPFKNVCVFCGSRDGADPAYLAGAVALGKELAARNIGLVYGGGTVGLMGAIAHAVVDNGGRVLGVIPKALSQREISGDLIGEVIYVDTMHERKARMAAAADAFIAMPGGYGTLEELFEVITWQQLGIHQLPIGLLNVRGYWDALVALISNSNRAGFVSDSHAHLLEVDEQPACLLDRLHQHTSTYESPLAGQWVMPLTLKET
jgi:uncharacterized protein (TIGR00730 family)